ncbi:MAG: arylesterase, partial [Planctomycetota bacterium]
RDEAFPNVLQDVMARDGRPFRLVNAGISGDTTAGGLRRIDWILKQVPDVVVVELGANDGLRGQDLDTVEKNLRGIVERVQGRGAEVLLLGMRIPPNYGLDYTKRFRGIYKSLAEKSGADFLPYFMEGVAGRPDLNLPDGIHPTAEGHRKLAENVRPALEEILERLGG